MSREVLLFADALSNEKDIDRDIVIKAVENALEMATKRRMYGHNADDVEVHVEVDRKTGEYQTYRCWNIVNDDQIEVPNRDMGITEALTRDPDIQVGDVMQELIESVEFGRIAAQIAKQVLTQKVREAERAKIVTEYKAQIGRLLTSVVKKVTREYVLLDLGNNVEAMLSRDEMIPHEAVRSGDRIRAYLYDVRYEAKGAQIFVSRTCLEMLVELFKIEVPEIGEQLIEIKAASRDPGSRAKIAVKTNDGRIDPIGACVGMRGARVQAVSGELGGERIDIILWDDNPAQLVINAMAPAEVESIMIDEEKHSMDIVVVEEQLSQAIGRNGQNVRLASQLTGWKLNIMTEKEAETQHSAESERLTKLFIESLNVDPEIANVLVDEGFMTLEEVAYVPLAELNAIEEFDESVVMLLRQRALEAIAKKPSSFEAQLNTTAKPAEDLLQLEGMSEELAYKFAQHGIVTREDLAEQSIDELLDINGLDEKQAGVLIMKAREIWFEADK